MSFKKGQRIQLHGTIIPNHLKKEVFIYLKDLGKGMALIKINNYDSQSYEIPIECIKIYKLHSSGSNL